MGERRPPDEPNPGRGRGPASGDGGPRHLDEALGFDPLDADGDTEVELIGSRAGPIARRPPVDGVGRRRPTIPGVRVAPEDGEAPLDEDRTEVPDGGILATLPGVHGAGSAFLTRGEAAPPKARPAPGGAATLPAFPAFDADDRTPPAPREPAGERPDRPLGAVTDGGSSTQPQREVTDPSRTRPPLPAPKGPNTRRTPTDPGHPALGVADPGLVAGAVDGGGEGEVDEEDTVAVDGGVAGEMDEEDTDPGRPAFDDVLPDEARAEPPPSAHAARTSSEAETPSPAALSRGEAPGRTARTKQTVAFAARPQPSPGDPRAATATGPGADDPPGLGRIAPPWGVPPSPDAGTPSAAGDPGAGETTAPEPGRTRRARPITAPFGAPASAGTARPEASPPDAPSGRTGERTTPAQRPAEPRVGTVQAPAPTPGPRGAPSSNDQSGRGGPERPAPPPPGAEGGAAGERDQPERDVPGPAARRGGPRDRPTTQLAAAPGPASAVAQEASHGPAASLTRPVPGRGPLSGAADRMLAGVGPAKRRPTDVTATASVTISRPPARAWSEPTGSSRAAGLLSSVSAIVMLLLFQAVGLPTTEGPPWTLLASPGDVTFVALAFLILAGVVHLVPARPRLRAGLAVGAGALMMIFALILGANAILADAFDGQPAMEVALGGPAGSRILLLGIAMALPFALFWRWVEPRRLAPRIGVGVAVGLVVLAYLGLHLVGPGAQPPLLAALEAGREAPFLGDRLVAWLGLMPLVVGALAPLALLSGARLAVPLASLFWLSVAVPIAVAALFVAKSEAWQLVLEPLKIGSFVAAPILYLAAALAALAARTEREDD